MGIETSTTIHGMNEAWPLGTDPKAEGDNHIRLIKSVLKTFVDDSGTNAVFSKPVEGPLVSTSLNGGAFAGIRNLIINGSFRINQRGFSLGTTLAAGLYGYDRWKADTGGASLTSVGGLVNVASGNLVQIIEANLIEQAGTYTLSWAGTATATVNGTAVANGGQVTLPALTAVTVKFTGGTVNTVQLEFGPKATAFERRPAMQELIFCQRYYEVGKLYSRLDAILGVASCNAGASATYAVGKRNSNPTVAILSTSYVNASGAGVVSSLNPSTAYFNWTWTSGTTSVGRSIEIGYSAEAEL
jgi:hypothetical protein